MRKTKFENGTDVNCDGRTMKINLDREHHLEGKICCEWVENNPESENYGDVQYDYFDEDELTLIETK